MSIENIEFEQSCRAQAERFPRLFFEDGRCRYDEHGKPVRYIHDDFGYFHTNPNVNRARLDPSDMALFNQLLDERFPGRADILRARAKSSRATTK